MEFERVHGINRSGQIVAEGGYPGGGSGTLVLTPIDPSPADANGDCITNFRDLLLVLSLVRALPDVRRLMRVVAVQRHRPVPESVQRRLIAGVTCRRIARRSAVRSR
jgi:hypothetical protein